MDPESPNPEVTKFATPVVAMGISVGRPVTGGVVTTQNIWKLRSCVNNTNLCKYIHSRMASLDQEITALKAEIEGYKLDLKDAISREEKRELRGLIKSCHDHLTRLLDEKKAQSAGTV